MTAVEQPVPLEATRPAARQRGSAVAVGTVVFASGAVVLAVQLAASRVLAPFFGNSLFVWGALIGVVLAGLALGYGAGGALADRAPAPLLLTVVAGAGGLAVLAVPLVDARVLAAVVAWDPGPRLNPVVAAAALFGGPSLLLAAVTPIAVRLRTRSVGGVGATAGRLFALSTAGSIAGTFATAFFLVPAVGSDRLFALAACVLLLAVGIVAFAERLPVPGALLLGAAGVAAAVAFALAPGATLSGAEARNWSPLYRLRGETGLLDPRDSRAGSVSQDLRVLYSSDTQYHRLSVVEDADTRYLRFDNSLQSAMYVAAPFRTRFRYTDLFHLGVAYNPAARDVLYVGLGAGSSEKRLWRDFPQVRIHAVELDPVVVDVAYRWFHLPRDGRLTVEVGDGRRFLAADERRWDVIVIDAFFADAIPFHLVTHEFLELARERLAPGGVVVTNVIGAVSGPGSKLFRSVYRTYRGVFPSLVVHPSILPGEGGGDTFRNLILVASDKALPEPDALAARWGEIRAAHATAPDLRQPILDRHDTTIPLNDVPTLTDDYAPTDALLLLFSQS